MTLARRSRSRAIREGLVPVAGDRRSVGAEYALMMSEFWWNCVPDNIRQVALQNNGMNIDLSVYMVVLNDCTKNCM